MVRVLSAVGYLKLESIVLLTQVAERTMRNVRCNHMIAVLKSDCFLVSQDSDIIGCSIIFPYSRGLLIRIPA